MSFVIFHTKEIKSKCTPKPIRNLANTGVSNGPIKVSTADMVTLNARSPLAINDQIAEFMWLVNKFKVELFSR